MMIRKSVENEEHEAEKRCCGGECPCSLAVATAPPIDMHRHDNSVVLWAAWESREDAPVAVRPAVRAILSDTEESLAVEKKQKKCV